MEHDTRDPAEVNQTLVGCCSGHDHGRKSQVASSDRTRAESGPRNEHIQRTAWELLVDFLLRWRDASWGTSVPLPARDEEMSFLTAHHGDSAVCLSTGWSGRARQLLPYLGPVQEEIPPGQPGGVSQGEGVICQCRQWRGREVSGGASDRGLGKVLVGGGHHDPLLGWIRLFNCPIRRASSPVPYC
jgi:hypothetical protein